MDAEQSWEFATRAIHAGRRIGPGGNAFHPTPFSPPLSEDSPRRGESEHLCASNTKLKELEHCISSLEEGSSGFVFSSGAAAYSTLLGLLKPGDGLVLMEEAYAAHHTFWQNVQDVRNLKVTTVDATNILKTEEKIRQGAKLIWVESPSSPLLQIVDIAKLARTAHQHQARLVVDNTMLGPYFQRPLALGADFVVHHTLGYLCGYADITGGTLIASHDSRHGGLRTLYDTEGAFLPPFECSMALLGIGTLTLRMREHEKNAMDIATFLLSHPNVQQVYYPGLSSHNQHEIAIKQADGFGGVVSFLLTGGSAAPREFLRRIKLFTAQASVGGAASAVDLPGITSFVSLPASLRKQIGITDGLVRLSAGIEDAADLLQDLENALRPL